MKNRSEFLCIKCMLFFWSINCMMSFASEWGNNYPSNVTIHEATTFEAKIGNGKASIKVPAGTSVEVAGIEGKILVLKQGKAKAKVHIDKTDYNEQSTKIEKDKQNRDNQHTSSNDKIKAGQNPYIREEPIGDFSNNPQLDYSDIFVKIPIKDWAGYQFLFMQLYDFDSKRGYPAATKEGPWHLLNESFISYKQYIGRSFTVQKVSMEKFDFGSLLIQMDDTKEKLYLPITNGNVKGVALKRDIDYARSNFIGKTLWIKNREASSFDSETKKNKSIKVKNLQPVNVIDVVLSDSSNWPVRFILKDAEGRTFTKVSKISGTNCSKTTYDDYKIEDIFYLEDPRKLFLWDERVFAAIESGDVFPGMTREQARVSWGKPLKINETISGGASIRTMDIST